MIYQIWLQKRGINYRKKKTLIIDEDAHLNKSNIIIQDIIEIKPNTPPPFQLRMIEPKIVFRKHNDTYKDFFAFKNGLYTTPHSLDHGLSLLS